MNDTGLSTPVWYQTGIPGGVFRKSIPTAYLIPAKRAYGLELNQGQSIRSFASKHIFHLFSQTFNTAAVRPMLESSWTIKVFCLKNIVSMIFFVFIFNCQNLFIFIDTYDYFGFICINTLDFFDILSRSIQTELIVGVQSKFIFVILFLKKS